MKRFPIVNFLRHIWFRGGVSPHLLNSNLQLKPSAQIFTSNLQLKFSRQIFSSNFHVYFFSAQICMSIFLLGQIFMLVYVCQCGLLLGFPSHSRVPVQSPQDVTSPGEVPPE